MKICIINNLYKPYNRGGADRIAALIAEGLQKEGHNIFFISTRPIGKKPDNQYLEKNYYLRSSFHYLKYIPKIFRFFWHFGDLFNFINFFKINKIIKKEKPDLIITHNLKGIGLISCLAIRRKKIKHIHYLHDIQLIHPSGLIIEGKEEKINNFTTTCYTKICSFLINSPQIVISPSQWLLNLHNEKKFFKNSLKKNLLNPVKNNPAQKNIKKIKKIFSFIYIAEIEEQKGILWAIQSFLSLPQKISNQSELIILGQGSKMKKIKKLSKNIKNIKIMGWQNNIEKYMSKADCLLVPSLCYDNSPTIIYEAAIIGLPVLASNLGGIPELINKFGGSLIDVKNKKSLAEKMAKLINKKEKILLKDKYRKELEKLNIKNYTKNLLKIIENSN